MNCEWIQQHLCSFLDGELAFADRAIVEEHVSTCADCAELRRRTEEEERALHSVCERRDAPRGFAERVMGAIQTAAAEAGPDAPLARIACGWRSWWTLAGVAAAVAVAGVALRLFMVAEPRQSPVVQEEVAPGPPVAAAMVAAVAQVQGKASGGLPTGKGWQTLSMGDRLPVGTRLKTEDGALVTLRIGDMVTSQIDGNSLVRLTERGLFVDSGRVFSAVVPGGASFAIKTADACATVAGTQFEIDCRVASVTRLRVAEGTVHFVNAKGSLSVGANMEATAAADDGPGRLLHADHLPALAWASVGEESFDFPVDIALTVREDREGSHSEPQTTGFQADLDYGETRYGDLWVYCRVTDASGAVVLRQRERVSSREHRYRLKKVAFRGLVAGSYTARFRIGHGEHAAVAETAFTVQ